ncbi:acyl-CoA dehydrogenase [Nocardioides sp.]|uniref:acyl-CoA dehydrogenase n=1 Tax=Nocardioides sp. TaxID=35761 RepID=UPI0025E5B615|nr:acyl-CoA dehydrogenase [Nocardioides sp.]
MRFGTTEEQRDFAAALHDLLQRVDVPTVARAWASDDTGPGEKLWGSLAELGLPALLVDEEHGGIGAGAVDLVVAFGVLGRHAVPGPWVESAAFAPVLLRGVDGAGDLLSSLSEGRLRVAAAVEELAPRAGDVRGADLALLVRGTEVHRATVGAHYTSVDATRTPADLVPAAALGDAGPEVARAVDHAALATAAQVLGAGQRMLADAVGYVCVRTQFGRPVGEFQAVKHLLADVKVALEFAAPLVHGAALALDAGAADATRAVSAAKVAATDAAWLSARTALQVHGAVGYTLEHDLSLWFTKVRALSSAWGTQDFHRRRVLDALLSAASAR